MSNVGELKDMLREKHETLNSITNMILFYESKLFNLNKIVVDKRVKLNKKLMRLNKEETVIEEKKQLIFDKGINLNSLNFKDIDKNASFEKYTEYTEKSKELKILESKQNIMNQESKKLDKLEIDVRNKEKMVNKMYNELDDEEMLMFNKYYQMFESGKHMNEDDLKSSIDFSVNPNKNSINKMEFYKEIDQFVIDNNSISREMRENQNKFNKSLSKYENYDKMQKDLKNKSNKLDRFKAKSVVVPSRIVVEDNINYNDGKYYLNSINSQNSNMSQTSKQNISNVSTISKVSSIKNNSKIQNTNNSKILI